MKALDKALTIKKIAQKAGVGIETIRFYERKSLLNKPHRTVSGYRIFSEQDIKRVRFIKKAQELGFSLAEIKELLSLKNNAFTARNDVYQKSLHKIQQIKEKIENLQKIKNSLEHLVGCCKGEGRIEECPIIEAFEGDSTPKGEES
ncbi:MAG: MerR family transcriptional regulator [Candidatus Paracaedimonas acanthamoebae]|jgi:MerR family copper efflux transcriptional regulator|uniref:Mercuric resistance operon regulatory protein n=1 Tax=Candidatus Paracaedimonas acanthamoebae TaxID=244581 RepID=A0A8J7PSR7_9PROT|nr:MerR family transcriptional regulator [Candidatus Paracaedimonas acanthamoebae]